MCRHDNICTEQEQQQQNCQGSKKSKKFFQLCKTQLGIKEKCNSIEKGSLIRLSTINASKSWGFSGLKYISILLLKQICWFYIILIALDDSCCVVPQPLQPVHPSILKPFFPAVAAIWKVFSSISAFVTPHSSTLYIADAYLRLCSKFGDLSTPKKKSQKFLGCYEYLFTICSNTFFFQPSDLNSELSYLKSAKQLCKATRRTFLWYIPHLHAICFFHHLHILQGVSASLG